MLTLARQLTLALTLARQLTLLALARQLVLLSVISSANIASASSSAETCELPACNAEFSVLRQFPVLARVSFVSQIAKRRRVASEWLIILASPFT